jgi:glycosyltransferase involved in cell wall biosynthesis
MSNFRPLKRTRDTIDAFKRIDPKIPALLLLVGDGPDLSLVREDALRAGVAERVRFLGEIDNVESIVSASDIALFPSESESFGLAALEAMACAVPVVATRVGGLPEVVVDGETGYLEAVRTLRLWRGGLTECSRSDLQQARGHGVARTTSHSRWPPASCSRSPLRAPSR